MAVICRRGGGVRLVGQKSSIFVERLGVAAGGALIGVGDLARSAASRISLGAEMTRRHERPAALYARAW